MREARVARFVRATPAIVERALTPAAVIEYEGSFDVHDVTEIDDVTLVTAGARGLELQYAFEAREDGLRYVQREGGRSTPWRRRSPTRPRTREPG